MSDEKPSVVELMQRLQSSGAMTIRNWTDIEYGIDRYANAVAKADPQKSRLIESLKWQQGWVRAALDCETWHWDPDQREAAEECYKEAASLLAELEPEKGVELNERA